MNIELIRKFLKYSFSAIKYNYDLLTPGEKRLCSRAEFNALADWILERKPKETK